MKKRFQEWSKLTEPVAVPDGERGAIGMLGLPGFQRMEDLLLLHPPRQGDLSPQVEDYANHLSGETFGIVQNDTFFDLPSGYDDMPEWSPERCEIDAKWDAHEEQFETATATDDETVPILLKLGFDFHDHKRGQPMRSVMLFARQAEAAAKGIMGKRLDVEAARLEQFASALEREAKLHMSKKRVG